jgi:hypothetical protein
MTVLSSEEQKQSGRQTYHMPTRLSPEDKLIVLGPFSLTLRQAFLLTLFGSLTLDLWRGSTVLATWGGIGLVVRLVIAALPAGVGLVWAFVSIAGRDLEDWGLVLLRYLIQPKCYQWQSLQDQHASSHHRLSQKRPSMALLLQDERRDQ